MKDFAPAADRNKDPIAEVLARFLPERGLLLEIASGTGQHAAHIAPRFPALAWQPTDADPRALPSIAAWVAELGASTVRPPLRLDVRDRPWPVVAADAVLCINMLHIAPWDCCLALLHGAADTLATGAPLVLYGPYLIDGETAASNQAFSDRLRATDPSWGVRELRAVEAEARAAGFSLDALVAMPANNHVVAFRRA